MWRFILMNDPSSTDKGRQSKSDNLFQSLFRAAVMSPRHGINPREGEGPAPLSASQQQMWFFHKLAPNEPVYNTFRVFRIRGDLNIDVFRKSIDEIVKRHDILRTVVQTIDEVPFQVVKEDAGFDFTFTDLSRQDGRANYSSVPQDRLQELLVSEAKRPLGLEKGPCLRIFVYKLGEREHCFQLVMHHFYCDGWSLSVFFRELATLYEAFSSNMPSPLDTLPVQYADCAEWQLEWLKGEGAAPHLKYWKDQLEDLPRMLNLPSDFPRPSEQNFNGGLETIVIEKQTIDSLKDFSARQGVTLFMSLLAAYQILLHRYSGQTDIVTGSPHANRNQPETHDLIGSFVNTLVLRTDMSGDPTFRELVVRVKDTTLDAYAHKDVPFQVLVEKTQTKRDMRFSPLFQAAFVLQNIPSLTKDFSGLTFEQLSVDNRTAKYDLNLLLREQAGEMRGKLEFSRALFKPERIRRFIKHFQVLLKSIISDPDRPVSELAIMDKAETGLLVEWSKSAVHYRVDRCVHELFQDQAGKTPDAMAALFEEQRLTYKELNIKANRLAHYLIAQGVGPEALVGIYLERSMEMVVTILAVLKAGAGYVPLDPAYPEERISFILEETNALLLTEQNMLDKLPGYNGKTLCMDREREMIEQSGSHDPENGAAPHNVAYVIYTSGSTGLPKGVVVEHRQVVRLFRGTDEFYRFNENDVWTLFHSCAFDFSVWELWGALLYGGTLVIVPFRTSRSSHEFYRLLINEKVTVLNVTPSVFRELMQTDRVTEDDLSLRYVIFGGEELKTVDLRPWYEGHDDNRPLLVNMYGITETTAHVTYRALSSSNIDPGTWSGIGRPIPDLSLHILDSHMRPVPVGVPGEIYVGGAGVARGYLNRPELNKEKFIPDRFSCRPEARLYRTGDLASFGPDGSVRFLGRIDKQVKLRGYRIELGEIESVLTEHPSVKGALVTIREDASGDRLLAGYLQVPDSTSDLNKELKYFLKQKLPDYMVPSVFIFLDAFPLTPNGKIDMKSLPEPVAPGIAEKDKGPVTASPLEERLIKIWKEIIKDDNIGYDDDFFEIGGHSLIAMRLIAWVHHELGTELSIYDIFEYPTVRGIAEIIEQKAVNR